MWVGCQSRVRDAGCDRHKLCLTRIREARCISTIDERGWLAVEVCQSGADEQACKRILSSPLRLIGILLSPFSRYFPIRNQTEASF